MCSEGLDIPTLNAEFLITPKTDVVQIVGRILRAKHAYASPIIYDFIDTHEVFRKQWLKRKAYYKKQNYQIKEINNHHYHSVTSQWKISVSQKKNSNDVENYEIEDSSCKENSLLGKCFIKIKK
jgi:superfamily II DNA or RNA helicase